LKNRRQHTCTKQNITKQKANLDNVVKKTKRKIQKQVDWGCLCGCNRKSRTNNITNTYIRIQKEKKKKKKPCMKIVVANSHETKHESYTRSCNP
jgi:uncharacterized protein (DUF2235 family)